MTPSAPSTGSGQSRYYAFGPFMLDGLRGMLWQYGAPVPLTPKVIQLLAALVSRAGELLPKDELIREVWGGTVVEENNLARHVSTIRKALGERPGQREYIATVPGVGYRFVASVTHLDELPAHYRLGSAGPAEPVVNGDHAMSVAETSDIAAPVVTRWGAVAAAAITAGVVAFAAASLWMFGTRDRTGGVDTGPTQRSLRQLSYGTGLQQDPAWSPDGSRIAYAADHSGNADLWVQTIGESEPVRLTASPFNDWQPSWSPNGEEIVFRSERDGGGLYLVSTRGGLEKRLVDFGARPQWSPSGALILFSQAAPEASAAARMYVMAPTGAGLHVVTHEQLSAFQVASAAWHPDGRVSLWGRDARELALVTFSLDGGPVVRSAIADDVAREILDGEIELSRFVWAPSGRFVYFEGRAQGVRNLWRVGVDPRTLAWSGPLDRLTTGPGGDGGLALSADGRRLAFGSRTSRVGVWSFPFDSTEGRLAGPGAVVTPGDAMEHGIDASSDGEKVIYRVLRSDRNELWERSGGAGPRLLVSTRDWQYTQPRWAPDGKRVAYQRTRSLAGAAAEREISILAVEGQQEQLLAVPRDANVIPADWSRDSSTILAGCRLKPADALGTCLFPVDGRAMRRLAYEDGVDLVQHRFSPDQRWISFSVISLRDRAEARVYVMPAAGGPRIPVTDGGWYDDKPRWAPDGRTLYFVSNRGGRSDVWGRRFDPARGLPTGEPFRVTFFDHGPRTLISDVGQLSMVISSKKIFLPMHEASGHLWLLEQVDR